MKRRNFLQTTSVAATIAATSGFAVAATSDKQQIEKEIYELKIFRCKNSAGKTDIEQHYRDAIIPFLNKNSVKVGAFAEYGLSEPPSIYFLHVYSSLAQYYRVNKEMWLDSEFINKSKSYFDKTTERGVFSRYETYLLEAFERIPKLIQPEKKGGLIELRIYESNNEEASKRKIKMFNNEEIALFEQVGLHCVMFGEVLAGPQLPALAYMLRFDDMKERDANWKVFVESSFWKTMKEKAEYINTVSTVNKIFLVPLEFSQI